MQRWVHGGSPGAGCCESRAPGCRHWLVPLSSVPSPSPAVAVSPVHCPPSSREASAHRSGTDPKITQGGTCGSGRLAASTPPPTPPHPFPKVKSEFSPMQEAQTAFGEHPPPVKGCPCAAGYGGCSQAGSGAACCQAAVPPCCASRFSKARSSDRVFGERRRDVTALMALGCVPQGNPTTGCVSHTPLRAGHCRASGSTFHTSCPRPTAASPLVSTRIFKCPYWLPDLLRAPQTGLASGTRSCFRQSSPVGASRLQATPKSRAGFHCVLLHC